MCLYLGGSSQHVASLYTGMLILELIPGTTRPSTDINNNNINIIKRQKMIKKNFKSKTSLNICTWLEVENSYKRWWRQWNEWISDDAHGSFKTRQFTQCIPFTDHTVTDRIYLNIYSNKSISNGGESNVWHNRPFHRTAVIWFVIHVQTVMAVNRSISVFKNTEIDKHNY